MIKKIEEDKLAIGLIQLLKDGKKEEFQDVIKELIP